MATHFVFPTKDINVSIQVNNLFLRPEKHLFNFSTNRTKGSY